MIERLTAFLRRAEGLRARPRLMAIACGLLIGVAQPPFGFLPGLLGYGLLLWLLEGDLGRRPKLAAFTVAWIAGFFYFLVSCFWVAEAFLVFPEYRLLAPFAATLLPAGIALFWGAFAVVYRRLAPKGAFRFLFFGALFTLFEVLRGTIMTGFPWNPAGATWRAGGAMSQVAAWAGVYGLSLITVAAACSVGVIQPRKSWRAWWPVLGSVAVLSLCFVGGEVRLLTTRLTPSGYTIRIVQPAIGQEEKWDEKAFDKLFDTYLTLTKAPAASGRVPDLVVWPEGALPYPLEDLFAADTWTAPEFARLLNSGQSFIMGVSRRDLDAGGHEVWRNSLVAAHQRDDRLIIDGFYNKFKLVPFGEFTPLQMLARKLGFKAMTHFDDSFTAGERTKAMSLGHVPKFLPLICYEGIFPALDMTNYKSRSDPARPKWILNISNDAWFGPTSGPWQHLNLASYRAIEEGLPMVRSTPTGISGMVDPLGRLVPGTVIKMGEQSSRDINLVNPGDLTVFARFHGLNVLLIVFLSLTLVSFETCVTFVKMSRSLSGPDNRQGRN